MLDQNGEVDRLANSHDLAEVQSVTEDDIKRAIQELKSSTESISRQTEAMKQQHDALNKLVQKTAETATGREDFERSRQRRTESGRKHIAAEVNLCEYPRNRTDSYRLRISLKAWASVYQTWSNRPRTQGHTSIRWLATPSLRMISYCQACKSLDTSWTSRTRKKRRQSTNCAKFA